MKLSDLLRGSAVTPARLRQEIFALGDRHRGDALGGARRELKDPRLTPQRRSLLRAVVAHLASGGAAGAQEAARPPSASLANVAYLGVFVTAAVWVTVIVRLMLAAP